MCIGPLKSLNVFKILSILKFQVYYFVIIRVLYYNFLCKSTDFFQFQKYAITFGFMVSYIFVCYIYVLHELFFLQVKLYRYSDIINSCLLDKNIYYTFRYELFIVIWYTFYTRVSVYIITGKADLYIS